MSEFSFFLKKMQHQGAPQPDGSLALQYQLNDVSLNGIVGQQIRIHFTGKINCVNCGRAVKSTFGDGYCFPCSQKLAACDICILKPELCHYRRGTCREPDWAKQNCLIDHVVYLCITSGLKVGITRGFRRFERWGDQGAISATVLAIVPERYLAGLVEVSLSQYLADKTDWRALLKGNIAQVDLLEAKAHVQSLLPPEYAPYIVSSEEWGQVFQFVYPIKQYLAKALTYNLDKEPLVEGVLNGIRGQYLLVGEKAFNVRKYSGYEVKLNL